MEKNEWVVKKCVCHYISSVEKEIWWNDEFAKIKVKEGKINSSQEKGAWLIVRVI